jgi:hypothetical protein
VEGSFFGAYSQFGSVTGGRTAASHNIRLSRQDILAIAKGSGALQNCAFVTASPSVNVTWSGQRRKGAVARIDQA